MLLQFSVKNFKSFKDKATISLIASNYDKETLEGDNINFDERLNLRILKSAVIYGANASGKSKLLEALSFMKSFVINSSKETQKGDSIKVEPFRLNVESDSEPTEFEIIFSNGNSLFRYGFETTKSKIISEWLYEKPKTKEIELYYRENGEYESHPRKFSKGRAVIRQQLVRDNALLLSVSAQFNETISNTVIDWFKKIKTISGINDSKYHGYTLSRTESPEHKKRILELIKAADLGIQNITLQKLDIEDLPVDMPKDLKDRIVREVKEENAEFISDVLTTHRKYDTNRKVVDTVNFSLDRDESSGTRKFFSLTGPILDVLENGYMLIVDELDSRLHPNLVCKIVELFNSKELNKMNSQLIFNTHDTNLLSSGLFRRDQIWFTDKSRFGESKLYSLADFKSDEVRKNDPFEENYIRGKYGAIPYLNLFNEIDKILPQYENEK